MGIKAFKAILSILVLGGLVVWLCNPPSTLTTEGKVCITFGAFGNPEQVDVYRRTVVRFEELHPDIDVVLRTPSSGGYLDKLKTEMAGRVAPDVTWVDVSSFYGFSDKQVFQPLTPFIKNVPEFNLGSYFTGIIDAFTYQGDVYALPKSCGSLILFYNMDHFDEVGLPYPDETWNWETVIAASKKLTRDLNGDGRYDRFALVMTNPLDLLWQYGVEVLSADRKQCLLNSPPAQQACQLLYDLVYVHQAVPTSSQVGAFGISAGGGGGGGGGHGAGVYDLFPMQGISMIITDLVLSIAYQKAPFRWDVAVQPRGIRAGGYLNGAGYAMNARTRHPEEAWELIRFLAGPEVQSMRAEGGDSLPSMPAIAQSPAFLENPRKPHNRKAVITQGENAMAPPYHPRWIRILQEITLMFDGIMAEEDPLPIEQALVETSRKIELILAGED